MFEKAQYTYRVASMDRVVDGDTIDFTIDLGFNVFTKQRVRLAGVDTPELRGGTIESKAKAREAKNRVIQLLSEGEIFITTEKDKTGKYGRYLGRIFIVINENEFELGEVLLNEGLATSY